MHIPLIGSVHRSTLFRITYGFGVLLGMLMVGGARAADAPASDDPASQLETLPGFQVEMVLKADPKADGSWISLGKDGKGRLLLGGQRGQPVTRVTIENGKVVKQERLNLPVSEVMGMLWTNDSLYVNASDGKKFGLFRLRDKDGDDQFESVEMLREWQGGGGEHGAHGIVLGADGMLYTVCGNFVNVPADVSPDSPHRNYADDLALPRAEDGNGFGANRKPPGGFVLRMDKDGKNAQLYASGERNTYDIAFNADGELLGFDSDMEWDWGMPWYRPTRVFHAVSGADHGFREGTGKWPEYYPDSLPAVVNIGIGSPTGVTFGAGAKFPAKYQKAMYVLDWSYGRVMAVHLKPDGAGYVAEWENFVAPKSLHTGKDKKPNNVTDVVIGADGALYFSVGGRNTQGYLYRVTYSGDESTSPVDLHDAAGAEARRQRHALEAFHGAPDPKAIEAAWPVLNSPDRYLRYAARIAVEHQPLNQWKERALAEKDPQAGLTALLALARYGDKADQPALLKALDKFSIASLSDQQKLDKLRVIEVSISRHGIPSGELAKGLIEELNPLFPAKSFDMNRELSQVLLALNAPDAVARTVKLLEAAPTQEEQIFYVVQLRTITTGWTPDLRRTYFDWWGRGLAKATHSPAIVKWFEEAGRDYANGSSFPKFLANFFTDARKTLTPAEAASLSDVLAANTPTGKKPAPEKVRKVVKEWTMKEIEPMLDSVGKGRSFDRGKAAYAAAQCAACHKFGDEGGATGPDLTAVSSRFARRDILESVLEPSKVVSEQYANTTLRLKDGDVIEGRVLEENDQRLVIQPNPLKPDKVTIKKANVKSRGLSKLSPMPEGLADVLTKEELLDLLAYMESAGKKDHPDFKK